MDTLYIGDIPQDYHFAVFNNNSIDLYNTPNLVTNQSYDFYRVYTNCDGRFFYELKKDVIFNYPNSELVALQVSSDYKYRPDIDKICITTGSIILIILLTVNLLTSLIRKGGVLGGLF